MLAPDKDILEDLLPLYFLYMFTIMHGSLIHTMYESTFI